MSEWNRYYSDKVRKVVKGGSMVELQGRLKEAEKSGWTPISPVREYGNLNNRYQVLCEFNNKRGVTGND